MTTDVKSNTHRPYSPELKERAVRLVLVLRAETGAKHGSVKRIEEQLDVEVESLRSRVEQAEIETLLEIADPTNAAKCRSGYSAAANNRRSGSCVAPRPTCSVQFPTRSIGAVNRHMATSSAPASDPK